MKNTSNEKELEYLFKDVLEKYGSNKLKEIMFEIINNPNGEIVKQICSKVIPGMNSYTLRLILEKNILMSMERKVLPERSYWLVVKEKIGNMDSYILEYYTRFYINELETGSIREIDCYLYDDMIKDYNKKINKSRKEHKNKYILKDKIETLKSKTAFETNKIVEKVNETKDSIKNKANEVKENIVTALDKKPEKNESLIGNLINKFQDIRVKRKNKKKERKNKPKKKRALLWLALLGGLLLFPCAPARALSNESELIQKDKKEDDVSKEKNSPELNNSNKTPSVNLLQEKNNTKLDIEKVNEYADESLKNHTRYEWNEDLNKKNIEVINTEMDNNLVFNNEINNYVEGMIFYGKAYNLYTLEQVHQLASIVSGEDNTSYNGALAVISTMCNRADDRGTDPLTEATREGQYTVYGGEYYYNHLNGKVKDYVMQAVYDGLNGKRNTTAVSFRAKSKEGRIELGIEGKGNHYFDFNAERVLKGELKTYTM